jgi:hypothetical protein
VFVGHKYLMRKYFLESKGNEYIVVEYIKKCMAYKVYDPNINDVFVCNDVKFEEDSSSFNPCTFADTLSSKLFGMLTMMIFMLLIVIMA